MFKTNLFKNTFFAVASVTNGALTYQMLQNKQREYERLKNAHPNANLVLAYQQYGYSSGGFKWVVKEPTTTPTMKR